jgi:MFS transporter, MHS family, proline/betaine transporter
VLRTRRRRVGILLAAAINATSYYILATYWPSFLSQEAGLDPGVALWASVAAYSFFICTAPVSGILSDHVGRRPMWLFATVGAVIVSVSTSGGTART